jgi:hypothetical protein
MATRKKGHSKINILDLSGSVCKSKSGVTRRSLGKWFGADPETDRKCVLVGAPFSPADHGPASFARLASQNP